MIIYGLIKNVPRFILLSYIGAELLIRLFYDLIYLPWMTKRKSSSEPPITPTHGFNMYYSTNSAQQLPNDDNSSSTNWLRKIINKIYERDESLQLTTVTMCVYTVTVSLVYYLTCIFAFQPTTKTSSMSFLILCLQQLLNIGKFIEFYLVYKSMCDFLQK